MDIFRHGDMVFRKIDTLPQGEMQQLPDKSSIEFADRWEVRGRNGHGHTMENVKSFTINFIPFVTVPIGGAVVLHEEHPVLALPQGTYQIDQVRSDLAGIVRNAVD